MKGDGLYFSKDFFQKVKDRVAYDCYLNTSEKWLSYTLENETMPNELASGSKRLCVYDLIDWQE